MSNIDYNQGNQGTWSNAPSNESNSNVLSTILGFAYDQATMGQQMANQEQLMELGLQNELELQGSQFGYQQALNQQGHDLQFDMWNKTNYEAQIEHMKRAGLNPALMYKQGGQGGITGSQTGGQAQKGNPTVPQAPKAPQFELYGLQAKLMKEQADDLASQRAKRDGYEREESESRTTLNEIETFVKASQIELNQAQVEQAKAMTDQVRKDIQMNYSEDFGKNPMVNLEKILSAELDLKTYGGLAMGVATLSVLRNPMAWSRFIPRTKVKGFVQASQSLFKKYASKIGLGAGIGAGVGATQDGTVPQWAKDLRNKLKKGGTENNARNRRQQTNYYGNNGFLDINNKQ